MRRSALGFTLVELLIAVTIIALLSTYALSNYSSFGEDQKLKNAALDIQSLLRQAQANSTSNLKCQNAANLGWLVEFTSSTSLNLKCKNSVGTQQIKSLPLPASGNITMSVPARGGTNCSWPTEIEFAPLYGTMISTCGSGIITITVNNSKLSGVTKSFIIEPGGRIYVQ